MQTLVGVESEIAVKKASKLMGILVIEEPLCIKVDANGV